MSLKRYSYIDPGNGEHISFNGRYFHEAIHVPYQRNQREIPMTWEYPTNQGD